MQEAIGFPKKHLPRPMPQSYCGKITGFDKTTQSWVIDQQFTAQKALSLMLNPALNDDVNFIELDGDYVILQILKRNTLPTQLTLQSDFNVQWITPNLSVKTLESMELVAGNGISVMAKNLMQNALCSIIQHSENLLLEARQFSAKATALMRLSGKQQVITAEDDVRIDGERINLG